MEVKHTVTATMKAWIPDSSSISPQALQSGEIGGLYYVDSDMTSVGWTLAGEADITVRLVGTQELVDNKVMALREEAKAIRAEATAKCTQIESQIQNLLALPFDGKAGAA
jgi:hypothetical protein